MTEHRTPREALRRCGAILTLLAPLAAASWSAGPAAACPGVDPQCVVEDTVKAVEGTVKDVGGTVTDTVKDVHDTTTKTVDTVKEEVRETTKPVTDVVAPDPATNPTTPSDPRTGPEDRGSPGEEGPVRPPVVEGNDLRGPAEADRSVRPGATPAAGRPSARRPVASPQRQPAETTPLAGIEPSAGPDTPSLGEAAIETARQLAFPLLLSLAVGAFLVIQHWIDNRHPKLALAPIETELLRFE